MKRKKIGERSFWYFLFMLPNLLLYGIFGIFPIALGIFYSFTDWNGIAKSWKMVGLGNYIKMLHDSRFLRAMRFNITYTLLLVVIVIALAMILAVMMDKMKWGKTFFRAVYFIPAVLSLLTVGIIFEKIYGTVLPAMGAYLEIDFLKKKYPCFSSNSTLWDPDHACVAGSGPSYCAADSRIADGAAGINGSCIY